MKDLGKSTFSFKFLFSFDSFPTLISLCIYLYTNKKHSEANPVLGQSVTKATSCGVIKLLNVN